MPPDCPPLCDLLFALRRRLAACRYLAETERSKWWDRLCVNGPTAAAHRERADVFAAWAARMEDALKTFGGAC